jgi:hypothetical protein
MRHLIVAGRILALREGDSAELLNCLESQGPVIARTRQDHAYGLVLVYFSQRCKENIDRHTSLRFRHPIGQLQYSVCRGKDLIRRDYIDMIRLYVDIVRYFMDGYQ